LKILLHGLNFAPEEIGIGKYSGEMVHDLLRRGCDVTVVTTPPYYPQWKIADGFRKWGWWSDATEPRLKLRKDDLGNRAERRVIRGRLKVIRCPLWVPGQVSGLKRIVHLASFGLSGIPAVLWSAIRLRPDVIMTVEPAAFCMPTTWLAARLCGAKAWLHVQDFEVDAAFELGILKQPLLKKLVLAMEGWLMRRFDRVSSISPNMVKRLKEKGVQRDRSYHFPNWVDCELMKPIAGFRSQASGVRGIADGGFSGEAAGHEEGGTELRDVNLLRQKFGIPADKCVALYAGNIGAKQGLDMIVEAAVLLRERDDIHFVICGHGAAYASLEQSARELDNVQLLPVQPFELFNELMNCADVHLLPQRGDAADLVMPSKLTGILATGRPVVACASAGTQIFQVVEGHGVVVHPGSVSEFAEAIRMFADQPELRLQFGAAARVYAVKNLSKEAILGKFFDDLLELCGAAPRNADAENISTAVAKV